MFVDSEGFSGAGVSDCILSTVFLSPHQNPLQGYMEQIADPHPLSRLLR